MLTIIVPTKDRSDFLLMLLNYYKNAGYRHEIFIADSSTGFHLEEAKKFIGAFRNSLKLTYFELPHDSLQSCIHKMVDAVKTPYAVFTADDDFLVPRNLDFCIDFLSRENNYIAANGKAIIFSLKEDGADGEFKEISPYNLTTIEGNSALDRLKSHFGKMTVPIFSVHRTQAWKAMFKDSSLIPDTTFAGEMLPSSLSVIYGKTKQFDFMYLVRQEHNRRWPHQLPLDWITSENWSSSYNIFYKKVSSALAEEDGMEIGKAEGVIRELFYSYLKKALFPEMVNGSFWSSLKRRFVRIPVFSRRILKVMKIIKKHIFPCQSIALPSLLKQSSPYYDDFKEVYNVVANGNKYSRRR